MIFDANVRRGKLVVQCPLRLVGGIWLNANTNAVEQPLSTPVARREDTNAIITSKGASSK
ncbi:hypothetical protein [uncultured Hyphomicrobium sp.]|uniref:hypothetical protein n=1 Tax=uncultured Hyphomicrobium sp. TaxID=194373 RepID=UPI002600DA59|nr:hypothetical protein [uncultured Hyphomicrobium sp.]